MANLLLLDDSEVAGLAMRGIAGRSRNRCVVATRVEEAWRLLRELAVIDLVVVELRLRGEDGADLIARIRSDRVFKLLPVVVYTSMADHRWAAKVRAFKVQNYLIKPYSDEVILEEIARARTAAWRNLLFEEERSFCAQMGLTEASLHAMLERLLQAVNSLIPALEGDATAREFAKARGRVSPLLEAAQTAGYWGLFEYVDELQGQLQSNDSPALEQAPAQLELLARLLRARLFPKEVPAGLLSATERRELEEAPDRIRWLEADVDANGQVVPPESAFERVDALAACPVIDTIAAEFRMAAETKSAMFRNLMDLVARDPGLSATVLVAANDLERNAPSPVEDPGVAASLLGSLRLSALAKSLPIIEERHMDLPPLSWSQFWLFQMGVAAVSLYTAKQLEYEIIQNYVSTAGLLHDIGKLLLLRIYPYGFRAMAGYAQARSLSLHEAETKYMGCTSRDLAIRFCQSHPLPLHYANVIRWVETPHAATEDVELVAVVSLARTLCLHNHIGYCGDTPAGHSVQVEETPAWEVLRGRVYPTFNLNRFDRAVQTYCQGLKQELLGRSGSAA